MDIQLTLPELKALVAETIRLESRYWHRLVKELQTATNQEEVRRIISDYKAEAPKYSWLDVLKVVSPDREFFNPDIRST